MWQQKVANNWQGKIDIIICRARHNKTVSQCKPECPPLTVSVALLARVAHAALAAVPAGAPVRAGGQRVQRVQGVQILLGRSLEVQPVRVLRLLGLPGLELLLPHPLQVRHVHVDRLWHN